MGTQTDSTETESSTRLKQHEGEERMTEFHFGMDHLFKSAKARTSISPQSQ